MQLRQAGRDGRYERYFAKLNTIDASVRHSPDKCVGVGVQDDGCAQCKACATSTTPHASLSSEESDDEEAVGFAVTIVEAEEDLGAVGFVNRRGESRMHADYDIFTFQSLRKRSQPAPAPSPSLLRVHATYVCQTRALALSTALRCTRTGAASLTCVMWVLRTSFMKAKAAAMHAKVGAIAVDNADDDQDGAASASTSAQHAASHVPLEEYAFTPLLATGH